LAALALLADEGTNTLGTLMSKCILDGGIRSWSATTINENKLT